MSMRHNGRRQRRWLDITSTLALSIAGSLLLCTAVVAAEKPTGELRMTLAFLGAQRMIPWAEVPSGGN
ncbi:MAG: hypothetical protein FJZ47_02680 [Candidatus Tectomicrobia bacterium]|uniref:Uncharacterized protein n=1 Tax=Tectimicrobiota bacterium TaxID=2528274 RepID=A0A937VY56_UNCTE|nr:hypothetical protein [Candidatus Tectomicrobia bacterium]